MQSQPMEELLSQSKSYGCHLNQTAGEDGQQQQTQQQQRNNDSEMIDRDSDDDSMRRTLQLAQWIIGGTNGSFLRRQPFLISILFCWSWTVRNSPWMTPKNMKNTPKRPIQTFYINPPFHNEYQ